MTDERLSQFLNEDQDLDKKVTSIPGGFLIKLTKYSRPPYVAMEINAVDTLGMMTMKQGILIRSRFALEKISNILTYSKIIQLADNIDEANPEKKTKPLSSQSDVFKI